MADSDNDSKQRLPPLYERNAAFVCSAPLPALTSTLLRVAAEEPPREFPMFADPSVPSQLFIIYDALPLDIKEKMKEALLRAAAEWSARWHSYATLRNIVLTAGYVRASGIVDVLRRTLSAQEIKTNRASAQDALEVAFGVLGGFAPLPSVRLALENLQSDSRYQKHFGAQIVNALCWCDPEHYPQYLMRFLETGPKRPVDVTVEMIRLIGIATVTRHIHLLNDVASDVVNGALNRDLQPVLDERGNPGYMDKEGRVHRIEEVENLDTLYAVVRARVNRFGSWQQYSEENAQRFAKS